ncbi:hypothetical protein BH20ACI3_BH20ACI3_11710 [soil metagenome]
MARHERLGSREFAKLGSFSKPVKAGDRANQFRARPKHALPPCYNGLMLIFAAFLGLTP